MGLAVTIVFLLIAGLAYAVSGGYATNSAIRVTKIPNYKNNPKLTAAHKWLSIAAVITWVSIALIVVGIVLAIIFAPEIFEVVEDTSVIGGQNVGTSLGKYVLYGLLFLIMFGVILVGILSAIAASDINGAKLQNDDGAARQATIAASIAIPVFVLILIIIIVLFTYKPKKKESEDQLLLANFGDV